MDQNKRLQRLEEARAAGQLNAAEFQELKRRLVDLPQDAKRKAAAGSAGSGREAEELREFKFMELLAPAMEIGPLKHRFRLERPLGEPSRSRVWLAVGPSPQEPGAKPRALKIYAPRLLEFSPAQVRDADGVLTHQPEPPNLRPLLVRIRARATLAAAIDHPNIVKVYGWRNGEDGWPFVEMEYLAGQSVRQRLQQEGRLSWAQTLPVLRAVAAALDHVHQRHHLPHRNLKPENVFITDRGDVKVLDIGLTYQPRQAPALPGVATEAAGPASPETPAPGQQLRFKLDVCALAALTYEMLTGKPPQGRRWNEQEPYTEFLSRPSLPSRELAKPAEFTDAAWPVMLPYLCYQLQHCSDKAEEWLQRLRAAQGPSETTVLPIPAAKVGYAGTTKGLAAGVIALVLIAGLYLWLVERSSPTRVALQSSPSAAGQLAAPPPQSVAAAPAWRAADERAFAAAQQSDTLNAYRSYLQRCPECAHHAAADAAMQRLWQAQREQLQARFKAHLQARELTRGRREGQHAWAVLQEWEALDPTEPFIAVGQRQLALAFRDLAQDSLKQRNYAEARDRLAQGNALLPGLKRAG